MEDMRHGFFGPNGVRGTTAPGDPNMASFGAGWSAIWGFCPQVTAGLEASLKFGCAPTYVFPGKTTHYELSPERAKEAGAQEATQLSSVGWGVGPHAHLESF